MSGLIRPKVELDRAFMPVLVTLMMIRSKINELAWTDYFPIIGLWEFIFLDAQGQLTP